MTIEIKENEPLSSHCTFRIGGPAKFFVEVKNVEEVKEAIDFAKGQSLPFFVLGGGSNILFSDDGYDGVIIKLSAVSIQLSENGVTVSAGTPFGLLISKTAEAGLSGLEWGMGIPGTVGGGVAGNCGAYGSAISNSVKSVTVLTGSGEVKQYNKEDCGFGYRTSKFKNKNNEEIILEVEFEFKKEEPEIIKNKIKEILQTRVGKVPTQPSAGSVFTNLRVSDLSPEVLAMIPPEKIKGGKLPAGYLIEECGLRGKKIGGGLITEQHANFIVNTGGATANDILALIDLCKKEVKAKFGINLEEEIIML